MKQRNYKIVISIIMSAMILFAFTVTAWGQQVTGAIVGTVTDPSDAPIVGAKVTATDQDRGFTYNSLTNTQGVYNFPRLAIGSYTVKIEQQGFQAASQKDIVIEINKTARIDVRLQVGQITQVTEISSDAPLLQTESTQLSTVIDSRTNTTLPLATRNYVQLTLLSPGSVNPNPMSMTSGASSGTGAGRPYINGNREQANNFLLDGINNNQVSDNLVGYAPSQEAIQEFNLITSNAPAEFGSYQGGIISVSIKSGTNQYHGSVYDFLRNDKLNANSWSNNANGAPKAKIRWNLFGATFSGPILKDKLFFFSDYQGTRFITPGTRNIGVLTDAQRLGDFSSLLADPDREKRVYIKDPLKSGECKASDQTACFANNKIPVDRFSPVIKNLLASKYYPASASGRILAPQSGRVIGDQGDLKLDYQLSDKDRFFYRYSRSMQESTVSDSYPLTFDTFRRVPTTSNVANWTRTLTPALVNEFRVGINYTKVNDGGVDPGFGNLAEELGISKGNASGSGLLQLRFDPNDANPNMTNLGSTDTGTQQLFANTVIQFEDSVIITSGKHILRTGFQFQRYRLNTFYSGNWGRNGFLFFGGKYTNDLRSDFLLGLPSVLGRGLDSGTWGHRSNLIGTYFQDDWKFSNSLSLNLGLRYERNSPWVEVHGRQANFDRDTGKIYCARTDLSKLCNEPTIYDDKRALYNPTNWAIGNFQPRIGFAWSPGGTGGKTVVRGSYTISSYLEGTGTNLRLTMNPPFATEFEANYSSSKANLPPTTMSDGLTTIKKADDPFAGANLRLWDPNVRPAVVQQWNLSIQRQLTNSMTLQLGYVGQHGTHLMVPMAYFQDRLLGRNPDGTPNIEKNPLKANPIIKSIGNISGTESNGNSKYNSLQSTLQQRFGNGLQFQVAYTYSKTMTDSSGYYGSWGGQAMPADPYWQNLYDRKAEWGRAYYDATHILSSYVIYELPVGKGKRFGSNLPKVANAIVGNWQISPIIQIRSGFPLTAKHWAADTSGTGSRGSRPNCTGPVKYNKTPLTGDLRGIRWFEYTSFATPQDGTFGNCGISTIMGPGMKNIDLSLQKQFPISETKHIEFRGEFINFTNTPTLNTPATNFDPSSMGVISGSQPGRNIQLALKFVF